MCGQNLEDQTIDYYNKRSNEFVSNTLNVNLDSFYESFLSLLKPESHILDAGCGSGRDSLHFLQHGYKVTAFDASREMVKKASELTELNVLQLKFLDVDFVEEFDGIWACASLLHVPKLYIHDVLNRLNQSLRNGGIFYLSFKYGDNEQFRNGRLFSDYTEKSFIELINHHPELSILKLWKTSDIRQNRDNEYWLNAILQNEVTKNPSDN